MLTVFNRKELLVTYDLNHFSQVRDRLSAQGIDYIYRTKDMVGHGRMGRGGRSTMGLNHEVRVEYKLYVHKNHYEQARTIL